MPNLSDPPLEALAHALRGNAVPVSPGPAVFLRARPGPALRALPGLRPQCQQSFRPAFDALQREGYEVHDALPEPATRAASVLALLPRQKDESRALMAQMLALAAPGGRLVASAANDEGAKSLERDLAQLAGLGGSLTKHHCRVFWSAPMGESHDAALAQAWRQLDRPRGILGGRYQSRPGVFAWDRIDPASALLAQALPATLAGDAADLGAGWGYLACELLARCGGIRSLDVYEAESRALALARQNLAAHAPAVPTEFHWHDVTAGVTGRYDVIVSNPPFHGLGREERPDIGRRFIEVAAAALRPGGELWLVANRHLPYEAVLDARFGQVEVKAQAGGFKVVRATRARA